MPEYRVFHLAPPSGADDLLLLDALQATFGDAQGAISRGIYREVARLDVADPEAAFRATNSGPSGEWQAEGGHIAALAGARSTSSGDLVLEVQSGRLSLCLARGWHGYDDEVSRDFVSRIGGEIKELPPEPETPDGP